jgi:NAD(P)-dependent dehydrogenase (short-subunit alcohol dehydrogenase family)
VAGLSETTRVLAGQVAVVSGGAGDIGRAICRELAARGATVALSDLRRPNDEETLLARLGAARFDTVDVRDRGAVEAWLDAVASAHGLPTLVIPCAALGLLGGASDLEASTWETELAVTLTGSFHVAQAAAQRLLAAGSPGRIVLIGSWAAHAPHPQITAYCVAKAGLRVLGRCFASELAPHGILVNEVAPGYVDAGLSAAAWNAEPGSRERALGRVPIGKLLDADDIARLVAFLCGPDAAQMTGSVLLADGGLSLGAIWSRPA